MLLIISFYKNKFFSKQTKLLLSFFSLLFLNGISYSDGLIKCWKNTQGLTECGNRIPREYYNQRIRYIDSNGVTRRIKERTKTREELDAQIEIDQLLALEIKQKNKAINYDEVLLKTYLTIDDLLLSLDSKLEIIESRNNIIESTVELKKQEFGSLVRQAANIERSGKTIPKHLFKKLDRARTTLRNTQNQITNQLIETTKIKKIFSHDVERFTLLQTKSIRYSLNSPRQAKKLHAARLSCLNPNQCDSHWQKANEFIQQFATTTVLYSTERIIVTNVPKKFQDIAMSLSLLEGTTLDSDRVLILQIRCNREREGREFCDSREISSLLKEFKDIIY
jgi:hypothetical protein